MRLHTLDDGLASGATYVLYEDAIERPAKTNRTVLGGYCCLTFGLIK